MIYRTLHSYILRELLRIFLLTAVALTTLMAFGGTFKPLTKQGIDVTQLLVILLNLMPAMLAYAIPIAALFAAVLVYWRMSTDNELTACRAGGVSFSSIVLPAFILGLIVASVDLVFVNYVVPQYLQATERVVLRDLGSLLVSQIGRQEKFQYDPLPLAVTADSAVLESSDAEGSVVLLHGMAGSALEGGRPTYTVVAPLARVEIQNQRGQDATAISFKLTNATVFDPKSFSKGTLTIDSSLFNGRPIQVPSIVRSKPKFLNGRDLMMLSTNPFKFPPVADAMDRIEQAYAYQAIALNVQKWWQTQSDGGRKSVTLRLLSGRGRDSLVLSAGQAKVNPDAPPEETLTFTGRGSAAAPGSVRVDQLTDGKLNIRYTCDTAKLILGPDIYGNGVSATFQLQDNVKMENVQEKIKPVVAGTTALTGVMLEPAVMAVSPGDTSVAGKLEMCRQALDSRQTNLHTLGWVAQFRLQSLDQTITSELHSRGSFSLSCLTLVLLGAALGILLRGKNPLAVFVVGFVPAIILVLLITAGRQVTEGKAEHVKMGLILIWAGNGFLLALVAGVYWKLLRR